MSEAAVRLLAMGPTPRPVEERFWAKVDRSGECWVWTGARGSTGYGALLTGSLMDGSRRMKLAHRLSWELHFGPIPDGMEVCHHCDNPPCVRPSHLFLGSHRENCPQRR